MNILLVGASGNLGSLVTQHLLSSPYRLRLLKHSRPLPFDLSKGADVEIVQGDLNDPASLSSACENMDSIVYLVGVLFQPHPGPVRLPDSAFYAAAFLCELFAALFRTPSPLNHDIVRMAMTSVVADTCRMKREIVPGLIYPSLKQSLALL